MVQSTAAVQYVLPQERLKDACNDRVVPVDKCPLPPQVPLTKARAFPNGGKVPDHDLVRQYIFETGKVSKECFIELCVHASEVLGKEPNLLRLEGKVVIVGDIHGQFYDLVAMLRKLSQPGHKNTKILFMGDYVDRGEYGPEVVIYLLALKLKFPKDVFMLRGNHESRDMTNMFNFRDQIIQHYDQEMYDIVMDLFDNIPIAAAVNGQYLSMHGGISEKVTSVEAINQVDRKMEPPEDGLLADLLWADPASAKAASKQDYRFNDDRQISVFFGRKPLNALLQKEGMKAVVRAHQVKQTGYKFHAWNGPEDFPPVITVFSAPDYCSGGNEAAVLISEGEKVDVRTFSVRKDKPYILHDRQDAFSFFQAHLQGHILDCIYQVLRVAHGSNSSKLQAVMSQSASTDPEYLKKVMAESIAAEEDGAKNKQKFKEQKLQKPKEEKKSGLDGLMDDFEDDLDIEGEDELMEENNTAKLGAEINMIKSASSEMIAEGERKMKHASKGDSVDQFMNQDQVAAAKAALKEKYKIDNQSMTEDQIKNLLAKQSKDNYKTMKELNKLNERAPPTKIAKAKQNKK